MKKVLLIGLAVLVAGGGLVALKNAAQKRVVPLEDIQESQAKPIIEIAAPAAYAVNSQGAEERELKNGEEIAPPLTIGVSSSGLATLYFPDGSTARIQGGTTFTLTEASYDAANGKSNTSIFLSIGRIWSKVVELATPDSSWEVETSNAVATVRGTAFDSESDGADSSFTGAESNVAVTPVNPETKERATSRQVVLSPEKTVAVRRAQLKDVLEGTRKLAVAERRLTAVAVDRWVEKNVVQDGRVDGALRTIKERYQDQLLEGGRIPPRLRAELRERIREEMRDLYEERRDLFPNLTSSTLQDIREQLASSTTPLQDLKTIIASTTNIVSSTILLPKPVSLALVRTSPTTMANPFPEGGRITGKAILTLSDGTKRDVTDKAAWKVLGPIGRMEAPGAFIAALDPSVAEFGESSGAIVVAFISPAGEQFLAQTGIFKVAALAAPLGTTTTTTPLDVGGQ